MAPSILTNKRGQGWGLDIVAAIVIFSVGLIILYVYAANYTSQTQDELNNMFYEGNVASELLLSEGDFGILTNGVVNQTKLNYFHDNYATQKGRMGIINNFYITMPGMTTPDTYAGVINTTTTSSFIQVTRIVIYENKPTALKLYVWK